MPEAALRTLGARIRELSERPENAHLELHLHFHQGKLREVRVDLDQSYPVPAIQPYTTP